MRENASQVRDATAGYSLRRARKWPCLLFLWLLQAFLLTFAFPLLAWCFDGGISQTWSYIIHGQIETLLEDLWHSVGRLAVDLDYLKYAGIGALLLAILQAAFVAPIARPGVSSTARPGWNRFIACGAGIAVLGTATFDVILEVLRVFQWDFVDDVRFHQGAVLLVLAVVLTVIATAFFRVRFRDGIPASFSLVIAAVLGSTLLLGACLTVLDTIGLVAFGKGASDSLPSWVLSAVVLTCLLSGWVVFTPLVLSFARRDHPESLLSRVANRLFIGSVIEGVATIPIAAMVRRRTSCFCSDGTFWTLLICTGVGLVVIGPAIYLLPLGRRRKRLVAGCCPVCGYDMKGAPAERCPECGAGWKKPAG